MWNGLDTIYLNILEKILYSSGVCNYLLLPNLVSLLILVDLFV